MEAERQDIYIGVSVGFFIGKFWLLTFYILAYSISTELSALSMIHGVEWVVEYIEALDGSEKGSDRGNAEVQGSIPTEGKRKRTYPEGIW